MRALGLALTLALAACTTTHPASDPGGATSVPGPDTRGRVVLVVGPPEGDFTVFDQRTLNSPAKGIGAQFGLLGLAIAYGIDESTKGKTDAKTTARVRPRAGDFSPCGPLGEAFRAAMREISPATEVEIVEQRPAGPTEPGTVVVVVSVEQWGLRRVLPAESARFAGFVDIKAVAETGRAGARLWDAKESVLSGEQQGFDAYDDAEFLRRQLEDAAASAGQRLAVRLLYPQGGKR